MPNRAHAPSSLVQPDAPVVSRPTAWQPDIRTLVPPFLVVLVAISWLARDHYGMLGWPLTVVWSWPIASTVVGICGTLRVRRHLRAVRRRWQDRSPFVRSAKLIVSVPTIGRRDTYPALERSVLSFCEFLPAAFAQVRVDIVTEEGCAAADDIAFLAAQSSLVRIVTVPRAYRTRNGTRFKARANHFHHELRLAEGEAREDVWVLHIDDDTGLGPDSAEALARFVAEQGGRPPADRKDLAQGILTYPRENAVNRLTWLADAVRPGEDFGRFAACTGAGTPLAGLHGEMLLIRASVEAAIGWDFGPATIVEDAHLALRFCALFPGRSAWFEGRCLGASPASVGDFVKQRERWAWGLCALVTDRRIPLRHRAFLAYGIVQWVCGPLQHVAVVLAIGALLGDTDTTPVSLWFLPIWALNQAHAAWMYWEGLRLNAAVSADRRRRWWEPVAVLLLIPVFSLVEGWCILRGFARFARRRETEFTVIAKPA